MSWFRNFRTLTKLMLAFALVSLITGAVGYQGMTGAATIHEMLLTLYERDMLGLSAVKQANLERMDIARAARSAIISNDRAELEQYAREIDQKFVAMKSSLSDAEKSLSTERGKTVMAKIEQAMPDYEKQVRELMSGALANDKPRAIQALKQVQPIARELDVDMAEISTLKEKLGQDTFDNSSVVYARLRSSLLATICSAVLLSFGIGFFIARLISKPLLSTVAILEKVAEGNLTASLDVESHDEVGKMATALNRATDSMRSALQEVRRAAEGIATSSQQLASASQQLASGAQEQASSLEETTAALEEITSTVRQNADNAKQANQVASGSRDAAERGGSVVSETVTAMAAINQSSKNIADIITAIDEIAFQTNLLALNAAVEAARAGEQGRGFAVVATEVRNLAQRSATSAKEIKHLIQDSVRKVEAGSELVNRSGETLREIVTSVKRVNDIVAEIASASHEQSVGIEEVNKAMMQMDQVTQTNSSQTEELSATAENLAAHGEELRSLVARFKLDAEGTRGPSKVAQHVMAVKSRTLPPAAGAVARRPPAVRAAAAAAGAAAPAALKPAGEAPPVSETRTEFEEF